MARWENCWFFFLSFFLFLQIKERNARALTGQTCTTVPQSPAIFGGEPAAERRTLPSVTTAQNNKQVNKLSHPTTDARLKILFPQTYTSFYQLCRKKEPRTNNTSVINMLPLTHARTRGNRVCVCVWTFNIVARSERVPQERAALCSSAEGIYSLFYSCSSSPDWLWQGGDEGEELFSSAGSSIIPVTPNRQKESSRGNLPSVSSGRRRRGKGGRKEGQKTINIKILSSHNNPRVFRSFSSDNLRTKRRASSFRFICGIQLHKKNRKKGGGRGSFRTARRRPNKCTINEKVVWNQ